MPELPEVETVRLGLAPHLVGRVLGACTIHNASLRWPVDVHAVRALTLGRRIAGLRRRAKYLLIDLQAPTPEQPASVLVIHLGMTGWLGVRPAEAPRKHDHVLFAMDDGRSLCFNDARRFGSVHAMRSSDEGAHRLLCALGVEPLDAAAFTGEYFRRAIRGRTSTIKERLMDGNIVVGVGNIYACEALHRAGISPRLKAGALSAPRAERLVEAVRETLHDAIANGGTTLRDFLNADGLKGLFAPRLLVYGRTDEGCTRCAAPVRRIVVGGRSTFFCPRCQAR